VRRCEGCSIRWEARGKRWQCRRGGRVKGSPSVPTGCLLPLFVKVFTIPSHKTRLTPECQPCRQSYSSLTSTNCGSSEARHEA
jgi:hypothetical protein